jgi:hypothetical protein
MVAYHACLFLLVAAIFPYMIAAQDFTEVFNWPGPTVIPDDGRMFISTGRVLVQLSSNGTVREARIREQVNITFDCGPHIDAVLASISGTPPGFTSRTTWYSVIREVDGTFRATNNTVQETAEIAIFGDNMRFLQIHTPLISVPAKQGNAGLYTCEFCYEFDLPLGGGRSVTCAQSNTDVNVRGDPPVIDRRFTPPDGNILIGTTICRPVEEVTVVCPQNGTTRPVGTANYLIDGMPIDLDNSLTFLRESRVTAAIDDRVSIFVSDFPATFEGVFTCNLTNLFGFDMERSLILLAPTVSSFAGTIQGTASTNCPSGTPAGTICPAIGQTVNLNCASNGAFNSSINITDPNGVLIATNSTSFMVDSGTPFGNYSCTAFNDCGMQTRTVTVQQCLPPTITRFGPRTGDSMPLPDLCYPTTIVGLRDEISIDCRSVDVGVTRAWFLNGVQLSYTFPDLPGSFITAPGNLTCVQTNACGSVSSTVHFPNESPNINNQSGQITDLSNPVLPGQTVCTDPSGSGEITLQCPLSNFDTSLRSNISWTSDGGTLASSMTPDDGDTLTVSVNANMTGTYTCMAENDCGSESASVIVLNRLMVAISGTLSGASDNGCTPPGNPAELCAITGSSVTISCSSSQSYTITGPSRTTTDASQTFTTSSSDYGTYTCSSTNACGTSTSTITLRQAMCPVPIITTVLRRGDNSTVDPSCVRSDNDLFIDCNEGSGPPAATTFMWFIDDILQIGANTRTLQVTRAGNYTCTLVNMCGSNTARLLIRMTPEIAGASGDLVVSPGSLPVTVGNNTCISSSMPSVMLECPLADAMDFLIQPVTRSWVIADVDLGSSETITVTTEGVYNCTLSNDCGSNTALTNVTRRPEIQTGTGHSTQNIVDIGQTICGTEEVGIRCFTSAGMGTRSWSRNGSPLAETTSILLVAAPLSASDMFTCTVSNVCGSASATSTVAVKPNITISGAINNVIGNGCTRPNSPAMVDYCLADLEMFTITCTTTGSGYVITGPSGARSENASLVITSFILNTHRGTYVCDNSPPHPCGSSRASITIDGLGTPPLLPMERRIPPTDPNNPIVMVGIGNDSCIYPNQTATLFCESRVGTPPITYQWRTIRPPNTNNPTPGQVFRGVSFGTHQCNASNVFGTVTEVTNIYPFPSVEFGASSPQGSRCSRLKTVPSGINFCAFVGDDVTFTCQANDINANVTIMVAGVGESGVMRRGVPGREYITINSINPTRNGTYTCIVANPCGSVSSTINIIVQDPAIIDRGSPLPFPRFNEVVSGAGRPDEPVQVRQGMDVTLHCPYSGIDPASTRWFFVRPDRFAVPINATGNPAFMVTDNGTNLILTITSFGRDLQGTYRCGTTNNAGDDSGDVVLQFEREVVTEWRTTPWSECMPNCSLGMRMRLVWCADKDSKKIVPDSSCNTTKPQTMENCTFLGPCNFTPRWVTGAWSECSRDCGGGVRTRKLSCLRLADGAPVPFDRCREIFREPHTSEPCNQHACCKTDTYRACKYIVSSRTCGFSYIRDSLCCWSCLAY